MLLTGPVIIYAVSGVSRRTGGVGGAAARPDSHRTRPGETGRGRVDRSTSKTRSQAVSRGADVPPRSDL